MFMILYPQLFWRLALDTMGLSWTMETSPKRTSQNDKDE